MEDQEKDTALTLGDLFNLIKSNISFIICSTVLGLILTASYSLLVTPIYASEALIAPKSASEQRASSLSSSLSSLSSLAGMGPISSGATREEIAYRKLMSKEFFTVLFNNENFVRDFYGVKNYNSSTNKVTYLDTETWMESKPHFQKAYEDFHRKTFTASYDRNSGLITLILRNESPDLSSLWLKKIISEINHYVREEEKLEAENALEYLKLRLNETKVIEVQRVIAALIQQRIQTLMLAEVSEEYLFDVVDEPFRPDYRYWPKRTQMTIIGTIISGLIAILFSIFCFINGSTSMNYLKHLVLDRNKNN